MNDNFEIYDSTFALFLLLLANLQSKNMRQLEPDRVHNEWLNMHILMGHTVDHYKGIL